MKAWIVHSVRAPHATMAGKTGQSPVEREQKMLDKTEEQTILRLPPRLAEQIRSIIRAKEAETGIAEIGAEFTLQGTNVVLGTLKTTPKRTAGTRFSSSIRRSSMQLLWICPAC